MWEWSPCVSIHHNDFKTSLQSRAGLSKRPQCYFPLLQRWQRWVWCSFLPPLLFHFRPFQWNIDFTKNQGKHWMLCDGYYSLAKYSVNSLADARKVVFSGNNKVFCFCALCSKQFAVVKCDMCRNAKCLYFSRGIISDHWMEV